MYKRNFSNVFASWEVLDSGLPVILYEIIGCVDSGDAEKVSNWFSWEYRIPTAPYSVDSKKCLAVASDQILPEKIQCKEHKYDLHILEKNHYLTPKRPDDRVTVENIVYRSIWSHYYKKMQTMFWMRNRTQRVLCENETEMMGSSSGTLLYPGFRLSVEFLLNHRIGLVLDSRSTLVDPNPLDYYFENLGPEEFKERYYGEYVIFTDEKGNKKPRYFVGIREGQTLDSITENVMGMEISLKTKYANTNPITKQPLKDEEKIAAIKYTEKSKQKSFFVPLSTLQDSPDLDDLKESGDMNVLSKEIYISPENKYEYIKRYLKLFQGLKIGKYNKPLLLHFSNDNTDLKFTTVGLPELQFADRKVLQVTNEVFKKWRYIKKNAVNEFGYYKKPTLDRIIIIHSKTFPKKNVEPFRQEFVKVLEEWNISISLDDIEIIPGMADQEELEKFIKNNIDPEIRYGAILILGDRGIPYDTLKETLNKYHIPSQGVREVVLKNRSSSSHYHSKLENVVAGIGAKCGGIPWVLSNRLSTGFYIGLDSGGEENKRCWSCAFVFDGSGKRIHQTEAKFYSKEGLPSKEFERLVLDATKKKIRSTGGKIDSLVIHRDGFLPQQELQGLRNAIKKLKEQDKLTSGFNCLIVNIRKTSNYRILSEINGHITNPQIGTYFLIDSERAVLATTGDPVLGQSTAKPLLIEVKCIEGDFNIHDVVRDLFYLSELNWGSPTTAFKMPITLYYAEKMIEVAHLKHKPTYLPV